MRKLQYIGPGIVDKGEPFQVKSTSFSIAETVSGYTLYKSVSCETVAEGKRAWSEAGGNVPEGWKQCSDPIPPDTQHDVYDVVPGDFFFTRGLEDEFINVRNIF